MSTAACQHSSVLVASVRAAAGARRALLLWPAPVSRTIGAWTAGCKRQGLYVLNAVSLPHERLISSLRRCRPCLSSSSCKLQTWEIA